MDDTKATNNLDEVKTDEQQTKSDSPQAADNSDLDKKIVKGLKSRVESAKRNRRDYYAEWKRNVELRLGKIASEFTGGVNVEDEVQTEINPDWQLVKRKIANLFSRVPRVGASHEKLDYMKAVPFVVKGLNYELGEKRTNIGSAMDEVLNDVVNASGIGAIYTSYTALFDTVEVPAIDTKMLPPQIAQQLEQSGQIPMITQEVAVDARFMCERISPTNLLWPSEFTGSDFNKADWLGFSGTYTWSQAKNEFDLDDELKEKVLKSAGASVKTEDDLRTNPENTSMLNVPRVKFDHVFYWRFLFDTDCKSFHEIWEVVWCDGIDEPVKHEAWTGQRLDDSSHKMMGCTRLPVQILTLSYITDNPVPPSDSSAARPQVNDMRKSRSQMFQQRERSIPVRWYNTDKLDPEIGVNLMRGTWQGMIPVQGDGGKAMGEIARASYPAEDFSFDQENKQDLYEMWGFGPGTGQTMPNSRMTKAEAQNVQQSQATTIGQERQRVAVFFTNVCETLLGQMVLYSDWPILSDQEKQAMEQTWDKSHITHDLVLEILPDATIVLDTQAKIQRRMMFLNMVGQSGFVNPLPIITELAQLSGLDPNEVVIQPQPKQPEEPQVSLRLTGKEDIMNPAVMAMLVKSGRAPDKQHMDQAKQILSDMQKPLDESAMDNGAPSPMGPGGMKPPMSPGAHSASAMTNPQQPPKARPQWTQMSKIAKRSAELSGRN